MYTNLWAKYLPVIRILLKKSLKEEQVLLMNVPDFERAGLKRKTGLKFTMQVKNGRPGNVIIESPLASSLISVLQDDAAIQNQLSGNEFQFSLNSKYELRISHTPVAEPEMETAMAQAEME